MIIITIIVIAALSTTELKIRNILHEGNSGLERKNEAHTYRNAYKCDIGPFHFLRECFWGYLVIRLKSTCISLCIHPLSVGLLQGF